MSVAVLSLLGPGTVSYSDRVDGGGRALLTRAELSALLSGLDRHHVYFALAKYAGSDEDRDRLVAHAEIYAVRLSRLRGWQRVDGAAVLTRMGRLAVFETLSESICSVCNGVGFVGAKACRCGNGRRAMSDRRRADFVGIGKSAWCATWRSRYEEVYRYIANIDSDVRRTVWANSN